MNCLRASLRRAFPESPLFKPWNNLRSPPGRRNLHIQEWFQRGPAKPAYQVKKAPWVTPMMFLTGLMPIVTFGLGMWQIDRLKWKVALIDELEEKMQLEPLSLPNKINLSVLPDFVWRKVAVKGHFDHAHTMLLRPRVRDGVHGVHVVTPLIREDGTTVLVNRGFVSNKVADEGAWSRPEGNVEVLGLIRLSQPRNSFTPDNHPEEGMWYWTDVDAMAEYAGGERANVQPVFVEQIYDGQMVTASMDVTKGVPIGRSPKIDIRNAHLSYIITWFSLCAFTSIMFVGVVRNRMRNASKRLPR